MGISGPYPVESVELFRHGLFAVGEVAAVIVYKSEPPVQERDKVSGLPWWALDLMDADPEARREWRTFRVKIAAAVQPVLPDPIPATSLRPVVLEGLTVNPWLPKDKETNKPIPKMEYALRATGLASVKRDAGKAA